MGYDVKIYLSVDHFVTAEQASICEPDSGDRKFGHRGERFLFMCIKAARKDGKIFQITDEIFNMSKKDLNFPIYTFKIIVSATV